MKGGLKMNMNKKYLLGFFIVCFSFLFVGSVLAVDIIPSKDPATAQITKVSENMQLEFSGNTPYSRVDKTSSDFFALKIEGPTRADFTFELDMHPEESSCKGIEIDYYKKQANGEIKEIYLYDASKEGSITHFTCEEFQKIFKTENVNFPSAGEYYLKVSDSSLYASKYKMQVNLSCIENNFNEDYTLKCTGGKWIRIIQLNASESSKPQPIPSDTENTAYMCVSGCVSENKCYPLGYRSNGQYCNPSSLNFTSQLKEGEACENLFECESNVCVGGQCISPSLIQKILNWFKNLFG